MFDAGAIISRMILDRKQWTQGMQEVQKSVQNAQDRFERMNRLAQAGVQAASRAMVSFGNEIKRAGHEIGRVGVNLAFFGAAITGPMMLAFNSMKNVSPQVAEQMERLHNVTQRFQLTVANAMVPVVERLVNVFAGLLNAFNSLDPVLQQQIVQWTLIAGIALTAGGVFLAAAGKVLSLAGAFIKLGGVIVGALGPWGILLVAVLSVAAAFGKLRELVNFVLDAMETGFYDASAAVLALGNGMLKMFESMTWGLQKFYELLGKIPGALGEPYRQAAKDLESFRDKLKGMINTNVEVINQLKKKGEEAFSGNGDWSKGLDNILDKFAELKNALENLGKTKIDIAPIQSTFSLIQDSWKRTADGMQQTFSNVFYDAVTGQLKSLKDYFADFGRTVLWILSDVLAKLLITQLFGSLNIGGFTPFNLLSTGHAEGIEEVPETGNYRLHRGEEVVPKYDAGKSRRQDIVMYNLITPEAVAQAVSEKAGRNAIINIIRADANSNGPIRKTIRGS